MKNTLSHLYLGTLLDVIETFGLSRRDAENFLKLPQDWATHPLQRQPISKLSALLDHVAATLNDPIVGLRVGHKFRISTFAKTGSIYGFCKDLFQVIEMNAAYQKLAVDLGKIEHGQIGNRHFARLSPYDSDYQANRHAIELVMGSSCTSYRWLSWASGEDFGGLILPYQTPANESDYEDLLGCPVTFDPNSSFAALEFTHKAMEQVSPTYDPEKLMRACAKLDELLGTNSAQTSQEAALNAAIRGSIDAGRVTTQTVSQRMGQDWSKVRLKLADPDRSFRDRTDQVRIKIFLELYEAGQSFAEISQALAYNDQPAFNRAFKRWFDTSPKKWVEERGGG